jgi:hypothetical protein
MGTMRNTHKVLVGKPNGTRPFGKPRQSREDNSKIELKSTGREVVDTTDLLQHRNI